jgi:hypothetical protein
MLDVFMLDMPSYRGPNGEGARMPISSDPPSVPSQTRRQTCVSAGHDRIKAGFAQAYGDAMEAGTDLIEQEARRRAVEGYDRPVFQRGKLVGVVRVYSDELAVMLLRGRRPEVYRDTKSQSASPTSIRIHGGLPDDGP